MMMNELQEIMFSVLKDHINRFVFKNDFGERDDVFVADFSVELAKSDTDKEYCTITYCYFPDSTLADTSIGNNVAFFVWFELFDRE